jgi:uncharacterized protein (DUF697 family)
MSLSNKRKNSILAIIAATLTNAGSAAVPTPGVETCKHVVYSMVEIGLCVRIYNIYFSEKLSKAEMESFLVQNGLAMGGGGALAFVGVKAGHGAINEILNFVPVVGWATKGVLAGSITASIGYAMMETCHNLS